MRSTHTGQGHVSPREGRSWAAPGAEDTERRNQSCARSYRKTGEGTVWMDLRAVRSGQNGHFMDLCPP